MLACLSLSTLTGACGNNPPAPPETVIEYVFLPESYLAPCAKPAWQGGVWLSAPELAIARGAAIDDCNRRLAEARKFQSKERDRLQPKTE